MCFQSCLLLLIGSCLGVFDRVPLLLFLALMCRYFVPSDDFGWRSDMLFVEIPGRVFGMVSGGFGDDFF